MASLSCEKCGSSDAMQPYSDGDYCFSCHHKTFSTKKKHSVKARFSVDTLQWPEPSETMPSSAATWLKLAFFSDEYVRHSGIYWAADIFLDDAIYKDRLIIPIRENGKDVGFQARSFSKLKKIPKYVSMANSDTMNMIQSDIENNDYFVLTEDILSSIRIAKHSHAVGLLGTGMSSEKLNKLLLHYPIGSKCYIWMDGDEPGKEAAIELDSVLSMCYYTKIISTELDPKQHTDKQIEVILNEHRI